MTTTLEQINQKNLLIKSLTERLKSQQNQISQLLKQTQQQRNEQNEQVKKIPFSMYKQFIVKTNSDDNIINEYTDQNATSQNENKAQQEQVNKGKHTKILTNNYLVLKLDNLNGKKQPIFLSSNLTISTPQKLNLNLLKQPQIILHDIQNSQEPIQQVNLKISKQLEYRIQFKESNIQMGRIIPQLCKQQSLPLVNECNILSQELKVLKQKLTQYSKVLQQQNNPVNTIGSLLSGSPKPQEESFYELNQQMKSNLTQAKWNQQKQEYIQYIKHLQMELQSYKNYKFSFNQVNQPKNNIRSLQKSEKPFRSEFSPIKNNSNIDKHQSSPVSQYLFKSPEAFSMFSNNKKNYAQKQLSSFNQLNRDPRDYHKNIYQINKRQQTNKTKGKVVYIRN